MGPAGVLFGGLDLGVTAHRLVVVDIGAGHAGARRLNREVPPVSQLNVGEAAAVAVVGVLRGVRSEGNPLSGKGFRGEAGRFGAPAAD
jgi:hypothetical protein